MAPSPSPPRFEKTNHHYIPQFWLRGFAAANGQLWLRKDGKVTPTAASNVMSEDWLYTDFDELWRPGDGVEDALSRIESNFAPLYTSLRTRSYIPTDEEWGQLCCWLAITACRHPIVMRRGHARAKEIAYEIADASSSPTEATFLSKIRELFGVQLPGNLHAPLVAKGDESLLAEAMEIEGLSPQDPKLPMQLALAAVDDVAFAIAAMDLLLLDAPPGQTFVLGDAPVPLSRLSAGFATPLSADVALGAWPSTQGGQVIRDRVQADATLVEQINRYQADRANAAVVGPDPGVLKALTI
jgi:hypothetical protein